MRLSCPPLLFFVYLIYNMRQGGYTFCTLDCTKHKQLMAMYASNPFNPPISGIPRYLASPRIKCVERNGENSYATILTSNCNSKPSPLN
ncbi:hypothetical protein BS47DRAFT_854795 [Hydnum rufescens UP504]|uniref:Uncharacterized protein n=1 Tax=Hydnum rufescens UP504 TaxID=1448309 RepID=A0A9P6AZE4_9AGAM|nr:hypothetical protein BS47DRAFT_854795 [Hydnum rufescens UP504]